MAAKKKAPEPKLSHKGQPMPQADQDEEPPKIQEEMVE